MRAVLPFALVLGLGLLAAADAGRIERDVERLAGAQWQGRRAGSPGADAAADWIAAELERAGLAPGHGSSFFQPFTFVDGVELGPRNRLRLGRGSPLRPGRDFRPLALSAPGRVAGEILFVGYGLVAPERGRDDYAGLDPRGRVVLLLRYHPDGLAWDSPWAPHADLAHKARLARERGAAAVLFVTGPRTRVRGDEMRPLRQDAALHDLGLPVLALTRKAAERAFAGAPRSLAELQAGADAGQAVARVLPVRAELEADVRPNVRQTRNVLGRLEAPGGSGWIVVGAHHDHLGTSGAGSLDPAPDGKVHHGADDNASGTAALLELARRLAPRAAALRRSLLFASFGAEEVGLFGSRHFVGSPPVPLARVAAMVNLDMIGRLRDELQVHGVGTSPAWRPLLERSNVDGLKLRMHESGWAPSDHAPFHAAGLPVLFFFTGVHGDYHRPSDTAGRVDARGVDRIVGLVERLLLDAAGSDAPLR
jgi:hypothetical protein